MEKHGVFTVLFDSGVILIIFGILLIIIRRPIVSMLVKINRCNNKYFGTFDEVMKMSMVSSLIFDIVLIIIGVVKGAIWLYKH
jgi:hypothetical protein